MVNRHALTRKNVVHFFLSLPTFFVFVYGDFIAHPHRGEYMTDTEGKYSNNNKIDSGFDENLK